MILQVSWFASARALPSGKAGPEGAVPMNSIDQGGVLEEPNISVHDVLDSMEQQVNPKVHVMETHVSPIDAGSLIKHIHRGGARDLFVAAAMPAAATEFASGGNNEIRKLDGDGLAAEISAPQFSTSKVLMVVNSNSYRDSTSSLSFLRPESLQSSSHSSKRTSPRGSGSKVYSPRDYAAGGVRDSSDRVQALRDSQGSDLRDSLDRFRLSLRDSVKSDDDDDRLSVASGSSNLYPKRSSMFDGPQVISPKKHDLFVALESRLLQSNQQPGRKFSDKNLGAVAPVSLDLATATLEMQVGVFYPLQFAV